MAFLTADGHGHMEPIRARLGDLECWEIRNVDTQDHVFHLHTWPFQVWRRDGVEPPYRAWRDTINLKPGERRRGVVSSVVNFGAFVDLGGMDGLVHVSELSWKHVDHPGSVVAVGDEIEVEVLEVDMSRERISLSLKATQQDPWQEFASNHQVGELVYGRVTKLVPFGSFIQVGDGIEGLVHISEMSAHHVDLPEQVVTPGEELWVKIIDLDLARRRISLSIKQAAEGGELAEEYRQHFEVDEHGNWTAGADDSLQLALTVAAAIVGNRLSVKGAPEAVIGALGVARDPLTPLIEEMAAAGLRVIAVADRYLTDGLVAFRPAA